MDQTNPTHCTPVRLSDGENFYDLVPAAPAPTQASRLATDEPVTFTAKDGAAMFKAAVLFNAAKDVRYLQVFDQAGPVPKAEEDVPVATFPIAEGTVLSFTGLDLGLDKGLTIAITVDDAGVELAAPGDVRGAVGWS